MTDTPVAEMSFEDAMKELEAVVNRLESGDVPLEDSIKLYERGAALKEHCQKKLAEAEEKVAQITLDGDGKPKGTDPGRSPVKFEDRLKASAASIEAHLNAALDDFPDSDGDAMPCAMR